MSTDKAVDSKSAYPPLSPQELATELGVSLSQRLQPDLSATPPKRFVTQEEAEARGMSWRFTGSDVCRAGHNAARRTANPNICSDCERIKAGLEPVYGRSRTQKYYPEPRRKAKDPSAPVVIAAPAAPAQVEPTPKEQELLAAVAEHHDLDKACAAVGWPRPKLDARLSVNEVLAKALNDLCDRLQIPRTLKAPSAFPWTDAVERSLVHQLIDTGLLHTAREAVGVSASEYFAHLESVPSFAAAIETAKPLALETLRERSLHAASIGNIHLLKFLTDNAEAETPYSSMSLDQAHAELERLLKRFDNMGLLGSNEYRHRVTGQVIDLSEFDHVDDSNLDLVQP